MFSHILLRVLLLVNSFDHENFKGKIDRLCLGAGATLLTMPLDVMKTRLMNAPPGTYNSLLDCFKDIIKVGPSGLFKGFIPAFIRLGNDPII